MRTNGILMAVSSLPGRFGIGDLGTTSKKFIDLLKESKIKIWQMLPLNPVGFGNSPYQSICGDAIDSIYIDIDEFVDLGIIKKPRSFNENSLKVDYDKVRKVKTRILKEIFELVKDDLDEEFNQFLKENEWAKYYAQFSVLFKKNRHKDWWKWNEVERYAYKEGTYDFSSFKDEILFIEWTQFVAFKQYEKLKKYANDNGVLIMGDIPFYIGGCSSDAWTNQESLLLDKLGKPSGIAGCPPDYFSKFGQRWGNPIYDWDYIEKDNFKFWIERIKKASKRCDILRIDHFRAFDTYWNINPKCPTAVDGKWCEAPGRKLFKKIEELNLPIKLIAEDLGELFPSVLELRDEFNLPGMNVLEFTLCDKNFETRKNQVIYTGTHDNDPVSSWYQHLNKIQKIEANILFRHHRLKGRGVIEKMIDGCFKSECDTCIIPMQDYLKLDKKSRMNLPGTVGSPNWEFRIKDYKLFIKRIPYIKSLVEKYDR